MRELKFRIWNKIEKKWERFPAFDKFRLIANDTEISIEDDNFEYPQYTGLLDKQGKEIYEGDILKEDIKPEQLKRYIDNCPNPKIYSCQNKATSGFGSMANGFCFIPQHPFPFNEYKFIGHVSTDLEIIGNRFENPELLEAANG